MGGVLVSATFGWDRGDLGSRRGILAIDHAVNLAIRPRRNVQVDAELSQGGCSEKGDQASQQLD